MTSPEANSHAQRARELLRGYPAGTVEAAEAFFGAGDATAFDRLIEGVLAHHLPANPHRPQLAGLPGSARLVEDVGLDSLAMVEINFLLQDLLGANFTDDELRALRTLDDLRSALRKKAGTA